MNKKRSYLTGIQDGRKLRVFTQEQRDLMSKVMSEEIEVYDDKGNKWRKFYGLRKAAEWYGCSYSAISYALRRNAVCKELPRKRLTPDEKGRMTFLSVRKLQKQN